MTIIEPGIVYFTTLSNSLKVLKYLGRCTTWAQLRLGTAIEESDDAE